MFVALVCVYTYPLILAPGSYLRGYNDPYLFTWMLTWVGKTIFTDPLGLFDTNIFFPYANTLAFSEPLIVPAVTTAAPIYALSGNPILAYNITLIAFQALCGWAAYYATRRITGSDVGAVIAGIVYCVSPFRTGYYNFLNIHLSFAVPLAFLSFSLFLEKQESRYLLWTLILVWLQAVTIWYGGIPLALLLCLVTLGFLLLRPRGWRVRTVTTALSGGACLVLALVPVALPYLRVAKDLEFVRSLQDVNNYRADLLSFLDAGKENVLYHLADSTTYPGLFAGFTIYALCGLAILVAARSRGREIGTTISRSSALIGWLVPVLLAVLAFFVFDKQQQAPLWSAGIPLTLLRYLLFLVLFAGVVLLGLSGWQWTRSYQAEEHTLTARDWTILLSVLALFCMLLTLGPVMHFQGQPFGTGIYAYVYKYFPGFKAIRISLRLDFLVLFLLGLLSAFGVSILQSRLRGYGRLQYIVYALPVLLLIEYLPVPLTYHDIKWNHPPKVYRWLASQPGDYAILEFPTKDERIDSTYVFWSLYHGKRLVNGVSGFYPPLTAKVAYSTADLPVSRNPQTLRSVYGLRYLLVHLEWMEEPSDKQVWMKLWKDPPSGLRKVAKFGDVIVFEIERRAEQRWTWERHFATDRIARSPDAIFSTTIPPASAGVQHIVDVRFNGELLKRFEDVSGTMTHEIRLPAPYQRVKPDTLTLRDRYRITASTEGNPAYRIGTSSVYSPADIVVSSAGKPYGSTAAIWINGRNYEVPRYRGYSAVVVDPKTGKVVARNAFDTAGPARETGRLIKFFHTVKPGHIVAVALNRFGGRQLNDEAFRAFQSIGAVSDPREHSIYSSHVLIGVKGAAPGTAIEAIADREITRFVGVDRRDRAMTIAGFHLAADKDVGSQ